MFFQKAVDAQDGEVGLTPSTSFAAVSAASTCAYQWPTPFSDGLEREAYIEEYRLTPDQFCAKNFRWLHSSRRGYYPYGKRDWIAAIKKIHKQHGQVFAGYMQDNVPHLYS